jgi:D-glycero-alpha-D-manno-heptose 1-phosphate guanylyltransferase
MECICLAGGLGTRLRPLLPDTPKCLAPVAGRAFLDILAERLRIQGVTRLILALGHGHDKVIAHIRDRDYGMSVDTTVEPEPLGTAGALRLALPLATADEVIVVNGDTWYEADIAALMAHHRARAADVTLALKPMADAGRYGRVALADGWVTGFAEKDGSGPGLVNGGVYVVSRGIDIPRQGSFERDHLAMPGHRIAGLVQDVPFTDIGVPADYIAFTHRHTARPEGPTPDHDPHHA